MSEKNMLVQELETLKAKAEAELVSLTGEGELAKWKTEYLGKNSPVMQVFKRLAEAGKDERARIGQFANQIKTALEQAYELKADTTRQAALAEALKSEQMDVTLPGRAPMNGRLHITTQTLREIYRIFAEMGFQIYRSPEVESDENNFELLIFPNTIRRGTCGTLSSPKRKASFCARTPPRGRCGLCVNSRLSPSAWCCRACATDMNRPTPATSSSSTRWNCWWWENISPLRT